MERRRVIAGILALPWLFVPKVVKADQITEGLIQNIARVREAFAMIPIGPQDGTDLKTSGGVIRGETIRRLTSRIARSDWVGVTPETRDVYSNGRGFMLVRFNNTLHNCSIPLGMIDDQDSDVYSGAMTLLAGPAIVALRVMTDLLRQRSYSSEQIFDLCWPTRPSVMRNRERAVMTFQTIVKIMGPTGNTVYADRDVLFAKAATCALHYLHDANGAPDGGIQGALIVNGREEFRFEAHYDVGMLK
jgi:hypothetical protein